MILTDYPFAYISESAEALKNGIIMSTHRRLWMTVNDSILMCIIKQVVGLFRHVMP